MVAHYRPRLTEHEASEVTALLNMVTTNPDQWTSLDVAALNRACTKIQDSLADDDSLTDAEWNALVGAVAEREASLEDRANDEYTPPWRRERAALNRAFAKIRKAARR